MAAEQFRTEQQGDEDGGEEEEEEAAHPATQPGRIKRNTACTSCRDAKVRCNPSNRPDQPCWRCNKLHLSCVVDKTHKRISRRSKIEELVQEIESIKQSVGSSAPARAYPPPTHRNVGLSPASGGEQLNANSPSGVSATGSSNLHAGPMSNGAPDSAAASSTPAVGNFSYLKPPDPSLPRALNSTIFSGEDIDYYFQMYFERLHPYMPIIRVRDPNKCYDSCPFLFWTIIYVASRRYAKTESLRKFLVDEVQKLSQTAMTKLPLSLQTINAFILICAWMFPVVRFINDPASLYSGVIGNAAIMLGIHTGKASHPEYSHGPFQSNFTDEEAIYSWAGLNIICQRVSSYLGLPPITALFNQTVQNTIDGRLPFRVPSGFRVLLECQKFCNRANKIVAATLEESSGVSTHVVQALEDEWTAVQAIICSERADDLDRFNSLLVTLEIQTFYMMPLQGYNPETLKRHVLRAFNTAKSVFRASLELDGKIGFLCHMTHFHLRSFATAACVIFKTLRLACVQYVDRKDIEQAAATDAIEVCTRAIISEGDLPSRLCALLKASLDFIRSSSAEWLNSEPAATDYPHRLSASVSFDCFIGWKKDSSLREMLIQHQAQNQKTQEQQQLLQPSAAATAQQTPQQQQQQQQQLLNQPGTGAGALATDTLLPSAVPDPFAIDWTFMDDFEWDMMDPPMIWSGMAR